MGSAPTLGHPSDFESDPMSDSVSASVLVMQSDPLLARWWVALSENVSDSELEAGWA